MNAPMAMFDMPNTSSDPTSQSRERTSCQPSASSARKDSRTAMTTRAIDREGEGDDRED